MTWFAPPLQDIWRASISWTFLVIAGCMCSLSHDNLRRSLKYGCVALLIYLVTTVAAVDAPISFGIIFCMAACTFVAWLIQRAGLCPKGPLPALAFLTLFLSTLGISHGTIGIGPLSLSLPDAWYSTPWLSWLGFPGPGFVSGDYYPVLPYLFIYLAGASMGWWWADVGYPMILQSLTCRQLEWVGRHALPIYIAHQPILLGICLLL